MFTRADLRSLAKMALCVANNFEEESEQEDSDDETDESQADDDVDEATEDKLADIATLSTGIESLM